MGSALLLGGVLELVRSRKLVEQYSLLWIFTAVVLLLAFLLGIHYPPSALFLIGFGFFLVILLHFSLVLSELSERSKKLAQEVSLLREELRSERPPGDG